MKSPSTTGSKSPTPSSWPPARPSAPCFTSEWRAGGFTRRDLGRMAALLSAGVALPFYNEAALAQDLKAIGNIPPDAVKINANENPMGPCPAAIEAIREVIPQGGRYLFGQTFAFVEAMAAAEGLPTSHIMPFAGSSDPLHRS